MTPRPRVVVIGGGVGELDVVQELRKSPCESVLVDVRNHHVFQPLLYQVATAALSPADIAQPIRAVVGRYPNVEVRMERAEQIDVDDGVVITDRSRIHFDHLVVAAGATHAYFGNDGWEKHAPGLKTLEDALEIRRRVLMAFERAEAAEDPEARRAALTFVVVGAGPTGVEMAGALREIAAETIPQDFRNVDTASARIILVEGQARVLPAMTETASKHALDSLGQMDVDVRLGTFVTEIDPTGVRLGDTYLPAQNVIWAAGVKGAPVAATLGAPLDDSGRVRVRPDCSIDGQPNVFVIGDLAQLDDPDTGDEVPGVAQGAIQMGRFVGRILRDEIEGRDRPRGEFRYRDKGSLATIGRARAVADIWGFSFRGFFAWILWSLVHVAFLIGFRNRILVLVNWAWQWTVQARGARLITQVGRPVDREDG